MSRIFSNKKGAEINITTIIVIILAILVLVILALYFTGGMKSLWGKITSVKGSWDQTDVENAQANCDSICAGGQIMKDTFCGRTFSVKKGNETLSVPCYGEPVHAEKLEYCKQAGLNADSCS